MKKEIKITIIGDLIELDSVRSELLKRKDNSSNMWMSLSNIHKLAGDTDNLYLQTWNAVSSSDDELINVLGEASRLHPDVVIYATSNSSSIIYATGGKVVYHF